MLDETVSEGSLIQLYVNRGYTLPTATTQSSDTFRVTADWASQTIINDGVVLSDDKRFTPAAAIANTISEPVLTMSNNNAGEASDYTFTFKSSVAYATDDKIEIYFPN